MAVLASFFSPRSNSLANRTANRRTHLGDLEKPLYSGRDTWEHLLVEASRRGSQRRLSHVFCFFLIQRKRSFISTSASTLAHLGTDLFPKIFCGSGLVYLFL